MLQKKALIFLAAFVLLNTFLGLPMAFGETNALLEAGINSYQKGNFEDAKANFVQLLENPHWSFAALYNLGNVAVRQKHLGEALGYYERALAKKPHDPDARFNLKFVEEALGGRRFASRTSNYEFFKENVLNRFAFSEFMILTFVFSILFLFGLNAFVKRRKLLLTEDSKLTVMPPPVVFVMGVFLLFFVSLSSLKFFDSYTLRGVITAAKVDLRSGPNESNASMQEVTEGSEVLVLDSSNDWRQVAFPGGLAGWIPAQSLMLTSGGGPF